MDDIDLVIERHDPGPLLTPTLLRVLRELLDDETAADQTGRQA